ncbi:uncharacterized protein Bfra_012123 [Botrytis fragariae]|uniref:Secreted protein n=1 Tax=Botrytis fragariae TaxID=1964551 RepID=A0A8H6AK41_9HELO|nr:uncharacterized protein Bfra_012123 [Botrytis fragariae]KAF5868791.1 hypothetical protein Bfra_012123 [Botrytis fragariae]
MKVSKACVFALITFFNVNTAAVIPEASTIDGDLVPFNMTTPEIPPPFVILSSSSSPTKTKRDDASRYREAKEKSYKIVDVVQKPWPWQRNKKEKVKPKATPRPCRYPETRPCITQKEIDQGWHDVAGCFNENLFLLGVGPTHCWDAGDDCIKPNCKY